MSKPTKNRFLFITAVALGTLLNPLNSSMIAVALSRIQNEFSLSFADASWLISTYYLASGIGQPVMGKLGDAFGLKKMYLIGLIMIAAASFAAPFSPSFGWLIAIRIIQAIGSSALFPAGMGIIRKSITKNQAQALGVLSIFTSVSAAFGPSIGGFLTHYWDWQAIFLVNFPFILAAFFLGLFILPKDSRDRSKKVFIDYIGILLFALSILSLLLFLLSWESGVNWIELLVSLVFIFVFYTYERKQSHPFIDVLKLKNNLNLSFVYIQFILVNVIFYSIFFGVPLYLQNVRHFDSKTTGLIMLSIAGFGVIVSPLAGRWIDKRGSKPALITGTSCMIAGSLLLLTIQGSSTAAWIFFCLSVLGLSNGFNNLGLQTALYTFVPPAETGTASGLFMTSRYIGTIFSSSLLGILFGKHFSTSHFHVMAFICVIIGILIMLLTIRMPQMQKQRQ